MTKWKIFESIELLKSPIGSFYNTRKIDPNGKERKYISMKAPDWVCAVVELDTDDEEKQYLMVRQFRHGVNKEVTEFPCGMVDNGEKAFDALLRELKEEIGIDKSNVLEYRTLYSASPNPAFMENKMTCYFVRVNGYGKNQPDDDEFLEVKRCSSSEVDELVSADDYNVMMKLAWKSL